MNRIEKLLHSHKIISEQIDRTELEVLLTHLDYVLSAKVDGDVVEFGCYVGTTSLFITRLLAQHKSSKKFHVYDSFEGLPEKSPADQSPAGVQFVQGALASSKQTFIRNFHRAGLPMPIIHKAWFNELNEIDVPEKIAFAFLDGDYYESITHSLRLIAPKLMPGGCVIVDDYLSESLPGVAKAVNDWSRGTGFDLQSQASLAILHNSLK